MFSYRRPLVFGVVVLLILLGCYEMWKGNNIVVIVFTGIGITISVAQALFPFPLGNPCGMRYQNLESELILPSSKVLSKRERRPKLLTGS